MDSFLRISLLLAIIVYFFSLFYMLKKGQLELKYTILWIFGGIGMFFIVLFPTGFMKMMKAIGIINPLNGIFAMAFFVLVIILMSITSIVSKLNGKLRSLIQQCALYEKRIRELEEKVERSEENK